MTEAVFERSRANRYKDGHRVSTILSPQACIALGIIGEHCAQENVVKHSLEDSQNTLLTLKNENLLEDVIKHMEFHWELPQIQGLEPVPMSAIVDNCSMVNHFYNTYGFPIEGSMLFFVDFYIQSFVDAYNERFNTIGVRFPSRPEMKRNLIRSKDILSSVFLNLMDERPYIIGFDDYAHKSVRTYEELEKHICKNPMNKTHLYEKNHIPVDGCDDVVRNIRSSSD